MQEHIEPRLDSLEFWPTTVCKCNWSCSRFYPLSNHRLTGREMAGELPVEGKVTHKPERSLTVTHTRYVCDTGAERADRDLWFLRKTGTQDKTSGIKVHSPAETQREHRERPGIWSMMWTIPTLIAAILCARTCTFLEGRIIFGIIDSRGHLCFLQSHTRPLPHLQRFPRCRHKESFPHHHQVNVLQTCYSKPSSAGRHRSSAGFTEKEMLFHSSSRTCLASLLHFLLSLLNPLLGWFLDA